jgi:hypothetical protein
MCSGEREGVMGEYDTIPKVETLITTEFKQVCDSGESVSTACLSTTSRNLL